MINHILDLRPHAKWMAGVALVCVAPAAWSACTSPSNWLGKQGPDVKVFIGIAADENLSVFGRNPQRGGNNRSINQLKLPAKLLGQEGKGSLVFDDDNRKATNQVFSYEPAGPAQWRLCRVDSWLPHNPSNGRKATERRLTQEYVKNNPVLSRLFPEQILADSTLYLHDAKGHLASVHTTPYEHMDLGPQVTSCTRFDANGNITLWFDAERLKKCPSGEPDLRAEWGQYKSVAAPDGTYVTLLEHLNQPDKKTGGWRKKIRFQNSVDIDNGPHGSIEADSVRGVTRFWGTNLGVKDNNVANMVKNDLGQWGGANYTFLSGKVPLEVMDNHDLIYQFKRRRESFADANVVMLQELFMPGEHRPRRRYYLSGGYMARHEQLDAKGRIRRIITVEGWRQPRPGPTPEFNDALLTDKGLRVRLHKIYHRVYDIDDQGVPKLVAVSWNKKSPLSAAGRGSLYSISGDVNVVYGRPDGKIVWKTTEAFEQAFDFRQSAADVYPDLMAERAEQEAARAARQKRHDTDGAERHRQWTLENLRGQRALREDEQQELKDLSNRIEQRQLQEQQELDERE